MAVICGNVLTCANAPLGNCWLTPSTRPPPRPRHHVSRVGFKRQITRIKADSHKVTLPAGSLTARAAAAHWISCNPVAVAPTDRPNERRPFVGRTNDGRLAMRVEHWRSWCSSE